MTLGGEKDKRLVRFDLNILESEELFAWGDCPAPGLASVSGDQRFGLSSARLKDGNFGIFRINLQNGKWELLYQSPDICNPHLQFRLRTGSKILVQENRGASFDSEGSMIRPCNERGVGLFFIDAASLERKDFPVGPPLTPSTTGHECWIADTDHVLVTLHQPHSDGQKRGNVMEVTPEWPKARIVFESSNVWNHVSASKCGCYFVTDCYGLPGKPILIGSIRTGKTRILCEPTTTGGGAQYTHLHP